MSAPSAAGPHTAAGSRPTRILLLTDNLKVGGVQTVVAQLANAYSSRGYDVGVAAEAGGDIWSRLPAAVSRHIAPNHKGTSGTIRRVLWLAALLRRERYDIVHAHQRGAALAARVAAAFTHVAVVEHVHNVFLPVTARVTSFRGHRLIACGPAIERMLVQDYKRPAHRIDVVPNGVPDTAGTSGLELPAARGTVPHLVAIGRLVEQKDPLRFVRTIHALNRDAVTVTATWVGGGELLQAATTLRDELGLSTLEFVGETADTQKYIFGADLLLMTSRWEGLPLVLLEAMALGRGAIVPDAGSCSYAVADGVNGRVYPVDAQPEEIAAVLRDSLDASVLAKWGRASRERYRRSFSSERMAEEIEAVYKKALQARLPTSAAVLSPAPKLQKGSR